MAGKDKITQKDVIDSSVVDEFKDLNEQLAISVKLMAELSKNAVDLNKNFDAKNIQDVVKSQEEYNKVSEESQKQNKETATTLEKLQQKIKDVNEEEERAKIALQEKRKAIRDNIKAEKDQTKETIKLTRELKKEVKTEKEATDQNKKLSKARKEIDITTAKGAKQVSLINKQIDKNNDLIKENASKLGKQKIGVGSYTESIKDALGEQQVFGTSLNSLKSTFSSTAGIIGAVTAVLFGLGKAYASSARGAEDLARASDRLKLLSTAVGNSLADLTGEAGFFDAILKSLQKEFLSLSFNIEADLQVAILSTIRQLEILDAEQESQKKSQLNRAEVLRQIRDEERNSFEDRIKANEELGEVINKRESDTVAHQEKILGNLQKLLSFNEGDLELQRQIKQVEFEIADAREEAQGFRSEALANDLALSREFVSNELELQKVKIDGQLSTTKKGSDEEFALRQELIDSTRDLELQAAGDNEQLQQIAIQKAINAQQSLADETLKIHEDKLIKLSETEEAKLDADIERDIEAFDERLERELEQEEELVDAKIELLNKETEANVKSDEAKKLSTQEWIAFAIQAAQELSSQIFGILDAQSDAQLNADIEKAKSRGASEKEIEKIEKAAAKKRQKRAIVEAIINTALAVTSALANPGGILGIVIAALAAVTGALSIATISSQSFAKGTPDSGPQGMIAEVGEAGTERINYADGSSALTPNGSTYTYLPPHSEVVPNRILQQDLAQMQAAGRGSSSRDDNQRRRLEHNELINTIKNKKEFNLNITEGGIAVTAKQGNTFFKYLDRHYRS